jgi:hypothetical protein
MRWTMIMERSHLALSLLLVALPASAQEHEKPLVTFRSPTECHGAHGSWRWAAKTCTDMPPEHIAPDHHIQPSDIACWDASDHEIKSRSPRSGREKDWFVLTGRVAHVKAEEDGDLHIELCDADNPHSVRVVVEVPVDHHGGKMPWNGIRETVFSWSDQALPFDIRTGHWLHLIQRPVVRVVGMAFYDAKHKGRSPNRRYSSEHVAVWEIHPVMALTVLPNAASR